MELEGTQTLRFILYENETNDNSSECKTVVFKGKASVELTSPNVSKEFRPKTVQLSDVRIFFHRLFDFNILQLSLNSIRCLLK